MPIEILIKIIDIFVEMKDESVPENFIPSEDSHYSFRGWIV